MKFSVDRYRARCDLPDGAVRLFPIGDEQLAGPPPVPRGVAFSFKLALSTGRLAPAMATIPAGRPAPSLDLLGEPLLSPTYMFGLRYRALEQAAPLGQTPLRVIATVSAQSPDYRVELIDTPAIGGVPTYHLKLTPLRHPKDNRLRELWVGLNDDLPRRAVIAGNFTVRPLVDVPWTVDFSIQDGAPYIARETAAATLYLEHRRVVRQAVVAFDDIREPGARIYDEPLIAPEASENSLVEPTR
ncbi:MAG: hypothetical protein JO263_08610 [Candidatus Eremiobacteraeota bacterium]|nr:hypothetical protein [Candidatus Eremiobacteraeota bacterium]